MGHLFQEHSSLEVVGDGVSNSRGDINTAKLQVTSKDMVVVESGNVLTACLCRTGMPCPTGRLVLMLSFCLGWSDGRG